MRPLSWEGLGPLPLDGLVPPLETVTAPPARLLPESSFCFFFFLNSDILS